MDHQGAGRSRSAADTRRQPPWPPQENPDGSGVPESTGPLPTWQPGSGASGDEGAGYGGTRSGPQRVLGPGTGPQRLIGSDSGAQSVLNAGSGGQPALGSLDSSVRTPVRGLPSVREQPEPAQGEFSPWYTPREP